MRSAIRRYGGAEIKTEGDSFYVVFDSVTTAVRCGLAVTASARNAAAEAGSAPIRVGIGIHAGETVETDEGYVGAPVNIAARICSKAGAGEVLVSETVRALTRTLLPVDFQPRGRPQLKGVADTVALYRVVEAPGRAGVGTPRRRTRRPTRRRGVLVGAGLLAAAVLLAGGGMFLMRAGPGLPPGPWKIAVEAPLSGDFAETGVPFRLAVQLALDDVNASGGIGGARLELAPWDDAAPPYPFDADRAVANVHAMADDPRIVGVVGPVIEEAGPGVVRAANETGLLTCAPNQTDPALTKASHGAGQLRSARPERNAFVRIAPSDDVQARALASFARRDFQATRALVIDDARDIAFADDFATEFTRLGGQAERRSLNYDGGADPGDTLRAWSVGPGEPDIVVWSGSSWSGGAALRVAMAATGHAATPLIGGDGLLDGNGGDDNSFIQLAGASAANTYATHATVPPAKAGFADRYRQAYELEPNEYIAAAHACAEVIVTALRGIAAEGVRADGLREAVRAKVTAPGPRYDTAVGLVGFDPQGDTLQQFVAFYRVEPGAAGGKGDWVMTKQQDFGPAS
jgi:branched-chain amino acid transport system substrate-binding protein